MYGGTAVFASHGDDDDGRNPSPVLCRSAAWRASVRDSSLAARSVVAGRRNVIRRSELGGPVGAKLVVTMVRQGGVCLGDFGSKWMMYVYLAPATFPLSHLCD
jgi:hypothetical protein